MNDWIITTLSLQVSSYFDQRRQFLSQLITAVGLLTLEILSNQVTTNKKNVWIAVILLLSIALRMINKRSISVTTFPTEFQDAHFTLNNRTSKLIFSLLPNECWLLRCELNTCEMCWDLEGHVASGRWWTWEGAARKNSLNHFLFLFFLYEIKNAFQ